MDNCNVCDGNAVISKCKTCFIKCCKGCFERHKHSCNILKEAKYHECQYHAELVKAYCCNCCQLICKECVVDNHLNHNSISLLEAYHNRNDIVKEFICKQPVVSRYIDACNETLTKYCILQVQIKEEEQDFQRRIESVRESLLQQVKPNIKQINDHCKAGEEVLQLQTSLTEHTPQSQKFALICLAQLLRYRNGLNAFEKQYMNCNILADRMITKSREDVHQMFLSKVVETASNCEKVNAHSYGTNDNRMDIDPIVPRVHTPNIPDMADQSFAGDPQKQTTHNDSNGVLMKTLEEPSTELRETANTCDKVNAHSYGTNDNRMDIDPIVPGVHTPTIPDMADQSFAGDPQQPTTHSDSNGVLMKTLEEPSTELRETANTCDKVNAHSYGTNDNRMDIDPIVPGVHTPTIPDMADQSFAGDPQQPTTHSDSNGVLMKKLEELSTELREHKRERAYILEFLKSFPERVDKIERMTEVSSTDISCPRLDNIVMVRLSEEMEHVFKSMMKIKNQQIKTEQDLKDKIVSIAKWTNDLGQSEKEQKRTNQGIVEGKKNKQLEILKKNQAIKDEKIKQLEKDLHQCRQGKTNLEKLETECNKLKAEQAKLQNQKSQGAEQYHKLFKENKDLQEGLKTAGEIINESQKKVADLENEVVGLKVTVEKKEHAIKALKEEKDGYLNRLSSMAGDKLMKGNPAIADLGDPNRPMKIAEKYGELYDNEWTDAMGYTDDAMRKLFPTVDHPPFDEILVYHLHRLVMCCYRECLKLSTEQEQTIRSAVINPMKLQIDEDGTDVHNMPGYREIVNVRRQSAQQFANTLFQNKMISMKSIITDWDYIYKNEELIGKLLETPFFEKCVHLCWYMAIQDPVLYLTEEIKPGTVYNRDAYKEFVQSGDKVKYVVWPALFLHEGGPLLYKGVVQAYK